MIDSITQSDEEFDNEWYLKGFRNAARDMIEYTSCKTRVAIIKKQFNRAHDDRGLLGGPFNRGYFDGLTSAFGA